MSPADGWVWHRTTGHVHAYPDDDGFGGRVSLCARVIAPTQPTPTPHDPAERCGLCKYRAKENQR